MSSQSAMSSASSTPSGSGKTKSTITSLSSGNQTNSRHRNLSDLLKRIRENSKDNYKELSAYEREIGNIDKVTRERDIAINELQTIKHQLKGKEDQIIELTRTYNKQLKGKEDEIIELKSTYNNVFNKFTETTVQWDKEKEQMKKQHSSENLMAQKELESSQKEVKTLKENLQNAEDAVSLANAQLFATTKELEQWKTRLVGLRDLDAKDLEGKIRNLFRESVSSVHGHFLQDLPENLLKDHDAWANGARIFPLKLPLSNTLSAKVVRVAVAMHVLSDELVKTIFRPCYLPTLEESAILQETLEKYIGKDRTVKSFMQAQFLSSQTSEKRAAMMKTQAQVATKNLSSRLSFMCQDGGVDLANRTERAFRCAADLWCEIQHIIGDITIITLDNDRFPGGEWGHLEIFGEETQLADEVFTLFPGFRVRDTTTELYPGVALFEDQEHVQKAESEWKQLQKMRRSSVSRGLSFQSSSGRRQPLSLTGDPTPPTSPISTSK